MAIVSDTMPPRSVAREAVLGYAKGGACALVLGAAFGGGLLAGGSARDDEPTARPADLIAAADDKTAELERVQEKLRLTFHDELTGAASGAPAPPSLLTHASAPAPAPAPLTAQPAEREPPPDEAVVEHQPPPLPVDEKKPAEPPADDEEMIAAPPRSETEEDRTRVARALAKVLGDEAAPSADDEPPHEPPHEPAHEPRAAAVTARYAVQVASTPSEAGAQALASKLSAAGHPAAVTRVELEGKGAMYRVRIGGFSSREAASEQQRKLRATGQAEGIVVSE